jgi:hypothetical protein
MDIFGTVANAIQLTKDLKALLEGISDAPRLVQRLVTRIEDAGTLLQNVQDNIQPQHQAECLRTLSNVETNLGSVKSRIKKYVDGGGRMGYRRRLAVVWNGDEFKEINTMITQDVLALTAVSVYVYFTSPTPQWRSPRLMDRPSKDGDGIDCKDSD